MRRPVQGAIQVIKNEARVFTYKDTAIITPNSDTPYSMLWLDLRAEPMVLSVPAVPKERYYSVMLCDPLIPSTMPAKKVREFGSDTAFEPATQPAEIATYVTGEIYGAAGGQTPY
jgi:hypothetical protein